MRDLKNLKVKIFADGADIASMVEAAANPLIKGFTTNPTLMRQAGVSEYKAFAQKALDAIPDRPISFEVFADDFATMELQAREIASWGDNVYVKIPVTNTAGKSAAPLIAALARSGIKLNITAIMTLDQVKEVGAALSERRAGCCVSVCGSGRRYGARSGAAHESGAPIAFLAPQRRASVGQSARAPESVSGRRRGMPHYYDDP